VWALILILVALALGAYLYLGTTCYFTERAFMKAYRAAMLAGDSHATALRAALRNFESRAPFNALTGAELDHASQALAALYEPRIVAQLVRMLDRSHDAKLLRDDAFLRGVVFSHSWLLH